MASNSGHFSYPLWIKSLTAKLEASEARNAELLDAIDQFDTFLHKQEADYLDKGYPGVGVALGLVRVGLVGIANPKERDW